MGHGAGARPSQLAWQHRGGSTRCDGNRRGFCSALFSERSNQRHNLQRQAAPGDIIATARVVGVWMMKQDFMFTSESVTDGHPDKLCDQVSDALVDRFLQQDPFSRVIAECAVSTGILFIAARFASSASIDIPEVARQVIHQIGYDQPDFNARDCTVMT